MKLRQTLKRSKLKSNPGTMLVVFMSCPINTERLFCFAWSEDAMTQELAPALLEADKTGVPISPDVAAKVGTTKQIQICQYYKQEGNQAFCTCTDEN